MTTKMTALAEAEAIKASEILKTDVLGRVKMPRERREQILDEFEKSGMAGRPFAKMIGVHCQTFATWIQKRRRARGQYRLLVKRKKVRRLKFAEAIITPESLSKAELTIELPGSARVKVRNVDEMKQMCLFLAILDKKETRVC